MSKQYSQPKVNQSFGSTSKSPQVQKVVNQRYTNGVKEYKIIWAGKTFEQATWEPEDNLNCPEKIQDFLKRYQQVIKRKNLLLKNQSENNNDPSTRPQVNKISLQKPSNGTQQKLVVNHALSLNKQKLQASLQKNNLISQKKFQGAENAKSKSTTTKIKSEGQKEPNPTGLSSNISNSRFDKIQTEQEEPRREFELRDSKQAQKTKIIPFDNKSIKKQGDIQNCQEEDIAQSLEFNESSSSLGFINVSERLDIEKICGILTFGPGLDDNKLKNSSSKKNNFETTIDSPNLFVVKNKFHTVQKIVMRVRLIDEQPLKLVEFYEDLLMDSLEQNLC